jgi:hypothetical protein
VRHLRDVRSSMTYIISQRTTKIFVKADRFCQIAIQNVGSLPRRFIKKPLTKIHLLLVKPMGYCRLSNCLKNCCSAAAALVLDRPTSASSPALGLGYVGQERRRERRR